MWQCESVIVLEQQLSNYTGTDSRVKRTHLLTDLKNSAIGITLTIQNVITTLNNRVIKLMCIYKRQQIRHDMTTEIHKHYIYKL